MANVRALIEQGYRSEPLHQPDTVTPKQTSEYRLFQDKDSERMASARNVL